MNLRGEEPDPRALGERMSSDKGLIQAVVGHRLVVQTYLGASEDFQAWLSLD